MKERKIIKDRNTYLEDVQTDRQKDRKTKQQTLIKAYKKKNTNNEINKYWHNGRKKKQSKNKCKTCIKT